MTSFSPMTLNASHTLKTHKFSITSLNYSPDSVFAYPLAFATWQFKSISTSQTQDWTAFPPHLLCLYSCPPSWRALPSFQLLQSKTLESPLSPFVLSICNPEEIKRDFRITHGQRRDHKGKLENTLNWIKREGNTTYQNLCDAAKLY